MNYLSEEDEQWVEEDLANCTTMNQLKIQSTDLDPLDGLRISWIAKAGEFISTAQGHASVFGRNNATYWEYIGKALAMQDCARDLEMMQHRQKSRDRDAARYNWLRRFDHFSRADDLLDTNDFNTLDDAVDHLMNQAPSDGTPKTPHNAPHPPTMSCSATITPSRTGLE